MSRPLPYLLGAAGFAAIGLFVYMSDREQAARLDRLSSEIATLSKSLDRIPLRNGRMPSPRASVAPMDSVTLEAIAQRTAALIQESPTEPASSAASPEEPLTPEREQALDGARRTLDAAITRGRLSRDDVLSMRQQLSVAQDPDEARELSRRIAAAINKHQLVPENPQFIQP